MLRRPVPLVVMIVFLALVAAAAVLLTRPRAPEPVTPTPGAVDQSANPLVETRQFMFMSNRDGDWDIYVMSLADHSVTNLTNNDADDGFGSYSADGKAITFLSNRGGKLDPYMMNADGSDARALTNDLPTIISVVSSGRLEWDTTFYDSARTAFVTLRDLNLEVYARLTDGEHNLTKNGAVDWYPAWSPDASQIAFASDRDGNQEIYVMNADGSSPRRLTDTPGDDLYPMWGGSSIYFMSDRDIPFSGGKIGLYGINLDDASPQAKRVDASESITFLDAQRWPETGSLLYDVQADGQWDIFYADSVGRNAANLTDNPGDDLFPVWRPA